MYIFKTIYLIHSFIINFPAVGMLCKMFTNNHVLYFKDFILMKVRSRENHKDPFHH